jgi:FixJ family two-component response regulator
MATNGTNRTVFVVDDDPRVRDSLRRLLTGAGLTVETFASAEEFLEAADASPGGCLVLDVGMPGMGGLRLQQELAARGVTIPIVFMTASGDVGLALRAGRRGAADFFRKPYDEHVLLRRITEICAAPSAASPGEADAPAFSAPLAVLTPRERQVLTLIAAGRTSREMARELCISHRTVEVHRARLRRKLGVHSVAGLVRLFLAAGGRGASVEAAGRHDV